VWLASRRKALITQQVALCNQASGTDPYGRY
jgi:hypothetical protein